MLIDHLRFWQHVLSDLLPTAATRITVTTFRDPVLAERLRDTIGLALAAAPATVPVVEDPTRRQGTATTPARPSGCGPTSTATPSTSATADSPPGPRSCSATARNAALSPASRPSG
jgi:hypothetical protein